MNIATPSLSNIFSFTLSKFLTVGVLNTAVTMLVIFASKAWLGLGDVAANAFGYAIGMLCSFLLNKLWTFSHRGNTLQTAVRFLLLSGFAYLVNLLALKSFLSFGLNPYVCHALAMPFYTLVFYVGSKLLVFVKHDNSVSGRNVHGGLSSPAGPVQNVHISADAGAGINLQFLFLLLAALTVSAIVFFYRLTDAPLEVWDEARLANNALEMSKNGLSLITTYEWLPDHWNTKPPLLIWLMTISMRIFGFNEFGVRLPSVLASLATVLVVYTFVAKNLRRPIQAFLAVIIILASQGYVLVHGARTGNYDALLVLLTTAYLLAAFLFMEGSQHNRKMYFALAVTAIVLAFYTKTIQGLIFLPALVIYAVFARKAGAILRQPYFYVGCIVAVAACVLYYWYREQIDPGYFAAVKENDLGGRYANALEGHHGGPLWYLMRIKYFPWLLPSFIIASVMFIKGSAELKRVTAFLATCSVFYLCVISSAGTKLAWYAMPLVPLYAIICALGIGEMAKLIRKDPAGFGFASTALLCTAVSAPVIAFNVITINAVVAKKEARPYDQQSLALRSLAGNDERVNPLVVVHPGYPAAPGAFYVAPTLFYANALAMAGTATTIVQHLSDVDKDATLLVCGENAPVAGRVVMAKLSSGAHCALYGPETRSGPLSRN